MKSINTSKYTVEAGETIHLGNTFNFIKVIESTGRLTIKLKNVGEFPAWSGVYFKAPETIEDGFYIENKNNFNIEFEIVYGSGELVDESLKIIDGIEEKPYSEAIAGITDLTVTDSLDLEMPAGYRHLLLQNVGTGALRLGGAGGYKISPNGTFNLEFNGTLTLYGTSSVAVTYLK